MDELEEKGDQYSNVIVTAYYYDKPGVQMPSIWTRQVCVGPLRSVHEILAWAGCAYKIEIACESSID
ncbi:hypothetical protein LCGC14_0977400 [marine sediment metagenome]|uniref:Uncharacterized protein n=1 Tax=marine sediment metagenome TaxID=412755 RepID=A0A0F9NEC7_9ZZZZ